MAIGYIWLDDRTLFRQLFAYMDTSGNHRADMLFQEYGIKVKFKRKWEEPDSPYCFVFCSVPKRQIPLFVKAMEELRKQMILLGHDDYETCWQRVIKPSAETSAP